MFNFLFYHVEPTGGLNKETLFLDPPTQKEDCVRPCHSERSVAESNFSVRIRGGTSYRLILLRRISATLKMTRTEKHRAKRRWNLGRVTAVTSSREIRPYGRPSGFGFAQDDTRAQYRKVNCNSKTYQAYLWIKFLILPLRTSLHGHALFSKAFVELLTSEDNISQHKQHCSDAEEQQTVVRPNILHSRYTAVIGVGNMIADYVV